MNKQAFLNALHKALSGLPADQVADIASDYERHFIDGMQHGRTEAEIAQALGDPRKIALEFKAMLHLDAYQQKHSVANFLRMALAMLGLTFFNLFLLPLLLVVPVLVLSFYLTGALCFIGGAVLAGSGLSGISELVAHKDGRRMALAVELMDSAPTGIGLRLDQARRPAFEVSPYAISYGDRTEAESAAAQAGATGSAFKALVGALYGMAGFLLFWLGKKLRKVLTAGARRYLGAQVRLIRGTQKPAT